MNKQLRKDELVKEVAEKNGLTLKKAEMVINSTIEIIRLNLEAGIDVSFKTFGKFHVVEYPEGVTHMPGGKAIKRPAHKNVHFKPSKVLRADVNDQPHLEKLWNTKDE